MRTLICCFFFSFIVVLSTHGQRLVSHFKPVMAVKPDISSCETDATGNIYVSGAFNFINNKLTGGLIKLKPDGQLDNSFHIQPTASGRKAYPQPDGKVYFIGQYRLPDGSTASLVRLNADGTHDPGFVSAIKSSIRDLVVQSTGKVVVIGILEFVPDYPAMARLNADGSLDETFTKHSFIAQVFGKGVAIDRSDNLYVADGSNVRKLDPNGVEDVTYLGTGSEPPLLVYGVTVLASGKTLVHGRFTKFNGVNAPGLVRLNTDGTVDQAFSFAGANSLPQGDIITELSNGNIVVVPGCCPNDTGYLELDPNGALVRHVAAGSGILTMAESNGGVIVAGQFNTIMESTASPHIAKVKTTGELDATFVAPKIDAAGDPTILGDAQDRVIIGGTEAPRGFINNGIFTSGALVRLTPTGDPDNIFQSQSSNSTIWSGYVQNDGKYVLSGVFPGGSVARILIRLNSNGTVDDSFVTGTTTVSQGRIVKFSGNNIYLTGQWPQYSGINTTGFIRLNADGSIAQTYTGWQGQGIARSFAVQQDGRVWFSGVTTTSEEVLRRFNTDGTLDSTFPILNYGGANGRQGRAMAIDANGFVYIGGSFGSIGSIVSPMLAKLNPDGTQAPGFSTGTGFTGSLLYALQVLPSGNIAVAGNFTSYNGVSAYGFVVIDPTGALVPTPNVAFGPGTLISSLQWVDDALYVSGRIWNPELTQLSSIRKISFTNDAAPVAPNNLKAESLEQGVFNISWTDNSSNEAAFFLERSLSETSGFTNLKTLVQNTTSIKDSLISPNVTYYYRIKASGDAGESAYSNTASINWVPTPPAIPEQLAAVQQGIGKILVSWADKSNNETNFVVERSTDNGTTFSKVVTIARNLTQYVDEPEPTKEEYTYRIKSVGKYLSSAYTANVKVGVILGVEDQTHLAIYPNPARQQITIESGDAGTIQLISLSGVPMKMPLDCNGTAVIDLQGVASGIYILKFTTERSVITRKISVLP